MLRANNDMGTGGGAVRDEKKEIKMTRTHGAIRRSIRAAVQFGEDHPLPKKLQLLPEKK